MKKLAIVGSGPNTRDQAPFDDPSFDIWVFNEAANAAWCKRWSACFQMHDPNIYKGHNTKDPTHWEWLQRKHFKPIYMLNIDPLVPDSVRYPLELVRDLAGVDMFPTTFAYMAALAVIQGYEQIKFYGIELSATEYEYQANGYLFWFGFLRGKLGAENVDSAVLYLDKNIFTVPFYGYEGKYSFGADYFESRVKILDVEWKAAEKVTKNVRKAIGKAITGKEFEKVRELVGDFQEAMLQCGNYAGALAEAERYQKFGDRYADRGGFEYAAATAQRSGEEKRPLIYIEIGKIEYVWNVWKQTNNDQAAMQILVLIDSMGRISEEVGALLGMYRENISYIMKYDAIVQTGGKVLLEATA